MDKRQLNFFPYYDNRDLNNVDYLKKYPFSSSANTAVRRGGWQNLPKITVSDEKKANTIALQSLTIGADGVLFDMSLALAMLISICYLKKLIGLTVTFHLYITRYKNIATKILSYAAQQTL